MSEQQKRIQVIFTNKQYSILQQLKGEMGNSDSEVVRNIVMSWLIERSFITSAIKNRVFNKSGDGGDPRN